MSPDAGLAQLDRAVLVDLAPVLRRAIGLDPRSLVRFRVGDGRAAALVRLPFDVLVSRTVPLEADAPQLDVAVRAADALGWLDHPDAAPPQQRDAEWRSGLPPARGWARVERVPDTAIRRLVRSGAQTLTEAAEREGVPGAQPRAEVADALLDTVVLTAEHDGARAEVTLRMISALTRMGFLPAGGHAYVDTSGRWIRVVAEHGTVYRERPGSGLSLA